jgi:CoA:oxalate CoA-transferase
VAQVLADPQVLARNMIVETRDASGARQRMAGNPVKISGFEDPTTRRAAPELDADRDSLLGKGAKAD